MIVSIHVPKCAGTSFRHILDGIYGSQVWYNYGTVFSREQAGPGSVPEGAKVVHGHFLADAFDDLLQERQLLAWVRHPVERVTSHYYHFLRSPDMRDDCCRLLHEHGLGLREFADLDWMQNMTTRYLAGKPVEDFEFIGVAERFQESVQHFCRVFGFRNVLRLPRENTNPERKSGHYDLSPADHQFILSRNLKDLELYEAASRRLGDSVEEKYTRTA